MRDGLSGPDDFPRLFTISSAFFYRFVPRTINPLPTEYLYIPVSRLHGDNWLRMMNAISKWNYSYEAAQYRFDLFEQDERFPTSLIPLVDRPEYDVNLCLVPKTRTRYCEYGPIYHLLPRRLLDRYGLPPLGAGQWPPHGPDYGVDLVLPTDFQQRLSEAFAAYVWRKIDSGSGIRAFSSGDPLKLLAHNLDFWLPHVHRVVEEIIATFNRVDRGDAETNLMEQLQADQPPDIIVSRPRRGGDLWRGEMDAAEVLNWVVEVADSNGRLRDIIDAVRSHRVHDDFSPHWSFAREDFERKLYSKRSKIKVSFVELTDTVPVQGPESEVLDNVVYDDFLALLDEKERHVVILSNRV